MPAIRVTGTAPGAAMKAGSRGSSDTRERFGLRRALVVLQVALSLVLVVGALLFVRSLRNLMTIDAGFRAGRPARRRTSICGKAGIPAERRTALYDEITERLSALPGVTSGAQAFIVPVSGSGWNNDIVINGTRQPDNVNFNSVSADYFKTMGTPMLTAGPSTRRTRQRPKRSRSSPRGSRANTFRTRTRSAQVFQIEEGPGQPRPFFHIVGVVKDTKYTDLREPFTPLAFFAASQETGARRRPAGRAAIRPRRSRRSPRRSPRRSRRSARRSSRSSRRWSRRCASRCCASG